MFDLKKLFVREAQRRQARHEAHSTLDPDSDYHPSGRAGEGLEVEYQSLIATQFRRWGIAPGCVTIEVRKIGRAPDGFDVFVGMVRLARWHRPSALRVLIGLPLLESKVRKTVRSTWLADFSHFGGLWLHASEQLQATAASGELRELLHQVAPRSPAAAGLRMPDPDFDPNSSLSPVSTDPPSASGRTDSTGGVVPAGRHDDPHARNAVDSALAPISSRAPLAG